MLVKPILGPDLSLRQFSPLPVIAYYYLIINFLLDINVIPHFSTKFLICQLLL